MNVKPLKKLYCGKWYRLHVTTVNMCLNIVYIVYYVVFMNFCFFYERN